MNDSAVLPPDAASEVVGDLLELARASRGRPLDDVLAAVSETVDRAVGFSVAAMNVYRPGWDDYEVQHVRGPEDARETLLGSRLTRTAWTTNVFHHAVEIAPDVFFLAEDVAAWERMGTAVWEPAADQLAVSEGGEPWRAGDGLVVMLRAGDGNELGILSVDCPRSGRRPTRAEAELLAVVSDHAAAALESNGRAAALERHRRTLSDLLAAASRLAEETTEAGVLGRVCATAVGELGFAAAGAYLAVDGRMQLVAAAGAEAQVAALDSERARAALAGELEHGCALVKRVDALPAAAESSHESTGPLGWNDHRLLAPLTGRGGAGPVGALVLDGPTDRVIPDPQDRLAVRLLADHAATALDSIDRQTRLAYLASHDPLTGVRNRRNLHDAIDALAGHGDGVAVLLCDIDHFKSVNDRFGHETGDRVLARFGALLREQARAVDLVVRIGGEEFCLVLPGTSPDGALAAAERLRRATTPGTADLVPGLTISVGVATSHTGAADADTLLSAADGALYEAKQAGRNRSVAATRR